MLSTDITVLRVPPLCATFVAWLGRDGAGGRVAQSEERSVSTADLCKLATDLRAWLHQDMMKMKKKHMELGDPAGLKYLQHASLLDPRFKHRTELFLGRPEEVDQCKQDLKTHIVKRSEAYRHLPLAKDSVLVVEVEADEDDPVLIQLAPKKDKSENGRKLRPPRRLRSTNRRPATRRTEMVQWTAQWPRELVLWTKCSMEVLHQMSSCQTKVHWRSI